MYCRQTNKHGHFPLSAYLLPKHHILFWITNFEHRISQDQKCTRQSFLVLQSSIKWCWKASSKILPPSPLWRVLKMPYNNHKIILGYRELNCQKITKSMCTYEISLKYCAFSYHRQTNTYRHFPYQLPSIIFWIVKKILNTAYPKLKYLSNDVE